MADAEERRSREPLALRHHLEAVLRETQECGRLQVGDIDRPGRRYRHIHRVEEFFRCGGGGREAPGENP